MSVRSLQRGLLAACFALGLSPAANAGVIFTPGNHPEVDEENILFGDTGQSGLSLTGTSNQSGIDVNFTSTQMLYLQGGGQAMLEGTDQNPTRTPITNIMIETPGYLFRDFIFSLENGDGSITITAMTQSSGSFSQSFEIGNGNDFFTILATDGDLMSSILIDADIGFLRFKHPRISGPTAIDEGEGGEGGRGPTPVPEPFGFALLGLGLVGLGVARRRRIS
jgi:hypothetical protein